LENALDTNDRTDSSDETGKPKTTRPAVQIHLGGLHLVIDTVRLPPRWLWGSIVGAAASVLSAWGLVR